MQPTSCMYQACQAEQAYNWLVAFFIGHSHCTVYQGQTSILKNITASIIQGSGIGPAAYVVNAADLRTVVSSNKFIQFADDAYFLIPASNANTRSINLENIETWVRANNLSPNNGKTKEIIFVDRKRRRNADIVDPRKLYTTARVTSLTVLGVTWTNGLMSIRSCAWHYQLVRANSLCVESSARTRSV